MEARCQIDIFLVHGTWGRSTPFAFPSSSFCSLISAHSNAHCRFYRFEWSGRNSHGARIRAGSELAAMLQAHLKSSPQGRKLYLIGHSHGGNVITYAVQSGTVADRVDGVFTIGTPFIAATPRNWTSQVLDSDLGALVFWVTLFLFLLVAIVFPFGLVAVLVLKWNFDTGAAIFSLIATLPFVYLVSRAVIDWLTSGEGWVAGLRRWRDRRLETLSIDSRLDGKLVAIAATADEAYHWLAAIVSMTEIGWGLIKALPLLAALLTLWWLGSGGNAREQAGVLLFCGLAGLTYFFRAVFAKLFAKLFDVWEKLEQRVPGWLRTSLPALVGMTAVALYDLFEVKRYVSSDLLFALFITPFLVGLVVGLVYLPVALGIALTQRLLRGSLGFGGEGLLDCILIKTHAYVFPPKFVRLHLHRVELRLQGRLRHSATLQDARVATFIARRMQA